MANYRIKHTKLGGVLKFINDSSITYTPKEPYALCFYLHHLLSGINNHKILDDYSEAIDCFYNCIEALDKKDKLDKFLNIEIEKLVVSKKLKSLEVIDEDNTFYLTQIPYKYEQDKQIERLLRNNSIINETILNLSRVIHASNKPIFSSIINTIIFKKADDFFLSETIKLTAIQKKAVFDISKTEFLIDQVKLTDNEARYILFKSRIESIENLRNSFRVAESNGIVIRKIIPELLNISEKEYFELLKSNGKLKTFGFIDNDGDYNITLNDCIEEQSIEPYFKDLIITLDCKNAYSLESYSVKPDSSEICIDLLKNKNPASILFYGKPGSGKTELAKSLCKTSGLKSYIYKNEVENKNETNALGQLVCYLSMEHPDSVLIVDEADNLLKTIEFTFFGTVPSKTKGTVNKMLESNMNKIIYIINHKNQIDESTLRRFTFSIKFESMPASMLRSIAKSKLDQVKISDETKNSLCGLLDKYKLTGASVDNIVKVIDGMECSDEEKILHKAQIVMKENSNLLYGKTKMRETVKPEYDPRVLNTSMNPLKIVQMVENASKFAEKNKGTENGIRMLFYGLSGTGKTELARYISEQLRRPILLKRASDIFGRYVGENEENIRDAFAEAENSNSILLFDEADSFFADRNNARNSWERTTVNEFLTQMEEFSGILICTTNLRNIMDPAMQRRFHMLVEFKPMKFEGIKIMAEKYFTDYHFSNEQIEELEDTESMAPGDFGALSSRIRFMNPADINSDYILEELKKMQQEKKNEWYNETKEKSHKIGF